MGSTEIQVGNGNSEDVEVLQAQAEVYNHLFAYADSLVLRSAVELRIADIIHYHGQPMSLSQIASKINSSSPDVTCLARVMRMLVRKKIFTISYNNESFVEAGEALYGLTNISKCLLHEHEFSLAPSFLSLTSHTIVKPWFEISRTIKEGGTPFVKAHGESIWDMASNNPEFNNMFNSGMASSTKPNIDAIIEGYKDGFSKLEGTLVDVGGGIGKLVSKIVDKYPQIEGILFDLPHTIENAPQYPRVTPVGGDMFKEIPSANNVIIKSVLLDWSDEDCIRILRKCHEAVYEKKGKVIIVDIVLHPNGNALFDNLAIAIDLLMLTTCVGGKQRTQDEWKKLLNEAGFTSSINFIPLQVSSLCVIEASL